MDQLSGTEGKAGTEEVGTAVCWRAMESGIDQLTETEGNPGKEEVPAALGGKSVEKDEAAPSPKRGVLSSCTPARNVLNPGTASVHHPGKQSLDTLWLA